MDIYLKFTVFIIAVYIILVIARYTYRHFKFNKEFELERFRCLFSIYSRRHLHALTPREFEKWTALLLKELGYENVRVTDATNDGGKDIICENNGEKIYVECKRYLYSELAKLKKDQTDDNDISYEKVSREVTQKLVGAMVADRVHKGMVITTGELHDNAKEYVEKLPEEYQVELIDGEKLCKMYEEVVFEKFGIPKAIPNIDFIR